MAQSRWTRAWQAAQRVIRKPALMDAGTAVVNGELPFRPTGAAAAAVALEHGFAVAGEAEAGVGLPQIASAAQSGTKQLEAAAGAEKPGLPIPPGSSAGR